MRPSGDDGCLKALLIGCGLLVSLGLLGWGLLESFAGSWNLGSGQDSSGAGVLLLLSFVAVPVFAVWLFVSLVRVTRTRRQALREAEAPSAEDDLPPRG